MGPLLQFYCKMRLRGFVARAASAPKVSLRAEGSEIWDVTIHSDCLVDLSSSDK